MGHVPLGRFDLFELTHCDGITSLARCSYIVRDVKTTRIARFIDM